MEFPPIEDLSVEAQKLAQETLGLREQNQNLMGKIEKFGASVDVAGARMEHILLSLVELGFLAAADMWQINLDWEKALRPQLKDKLAIAQHMRAEQIRKSGHSESGLVVPRR